MRGKSHALRCLIVTTVLAGTAILASPVGAAGGSTQPGIDVSHYDGSINWTQVATAESFAFMKATEGTTYIDPTFATNWAGAGAAGLYRGAYAFGHPNLDPVASANYFLATTGTMSGSHDLPPVLDLETTDGQTPAAVAAWGLTWLSTVEQATHRVPAVYTSASFFSTSMGSPAGYGAYLLWIAHWNVVSPTVPPAWSTWTFWNYGDTGTVPGVPHTSQVDVDSFNGTPTDLANLAGARVVTPSVSVANASLTRPGSGTAPMTFTVSLDKTAAQDVSVHYQATDGTALGLVDYTPTAGTATITAGQTSTTVSVPIIGNQSDEPDKTFTLVLSSPTSATLGTATATGTIKANGLLAGCPASPTQIQRYVCHIYWDALGRAAETGGFNYWVNLLNTGTPRLTMATSYLRTPEARNVLVDRLYVFFLGRHGDASGVSYWANKLLTGATPDDIRVFLATSSEFWNDAGATNTGFVTRLFADVFRRPVDAGGLAYWSGQLGKGASRASVVTSFLHTPEGRTHVVGDIYLRFLRRYPTSPEATALVNQLAAGTPEITIYYNTVASSEYFNRP